MADVSEEWNRQEREIIDKFFREKIPATFTAENESASVCTEKSFIQFAKAALKTDDVAAVDNQGSNSFTLLSSSLKEIIQFRLKLLKTDIIHLANKIYGDLVPEVKFHDGFPLPVYSCKVIPGRVHLLQPFPEGNFPLEREKVTVAELGWFVARAAFFEQPKPVPDSSWTKSAEMTLHRLTKNSTLRCLAPDLFDLLSTLQPELHLLESLPAVLTHHDFSQVNILVNDSGHVTGVIDFDEAGIEAFGMCIWGLYECFLGSMEDGKWSFYDMPAEDSPGRSVREVLECTFWDSLWVNAPLSLKREKAEKAVKISLSIGIINRYFIQGMMDEIDMSRNAHRLSLEYVRGILPQVWKWNGRL
jgi:Phosphotransferase enzyme family